MCYELPLLSWLFDSSWQDAFLHPRVLQTEGCKPILFRGKNCVSLSRKMLILLTTNRFPSNQSYHIHINGLFHSRLRYNQLHSLNEQVSFCLNYNHTHTHTKCWLMIFQTLTSYENISIELFYLFFLGKNFFLWMDLKSNNDGFSLKITYNCVSFAFLHSCLTFFLASSDWLPFVFLNSVSQEQSIVFNDIFIKFFFQAQQSTLNVHSQPIQLDVMLENETFMSVASRSDASVDTFKQQLCERLQLNLALQKLFDLFMVEWTTTTTSKPERSFHQSGPLSNRDPNSTYKIMWKLSHLESPYLSVLIAQKADKKVALLFRTNYWHMDLDEFLLQDQVGSQLLYAHAEQFIRLSQNQLNNDHRKHLDTLRLRKCKAEVRSWEMW